MNRTALRRRAILLSAALLATGAAALWIAPSRGEDAPALPPSLTDEAAKPAATEVAVLAGGCFWGVQGVFQHIQGVTNVVSGYAGGERATAEYETVSSGQTGHAESVQITYDPHKISYGRLLQIYFSVAHDPTELNRQGPDVGIQYRSAIFPINPEQARVARAYVAQLDQAHVFGAPIVTRIETGRSFYPAEAYHQDFLSRHPTYPYIAINDMPKIEKLKRLFPELYRPDPVLVVAAGGGN